MRISFFEEFPSSRVLKKCNDIKFLFNLYLADYSIDSFKLYAKEIKNKHLKKAIWWPLISKEYGYWISGFVPKPILQKLFSSLEKERIPVMLDLEYPKKRWLIIKDLFKVNQGKKVIEGFLKSYKGEIYTCEYFFDSRLFKYFELEVDPLKHNTKMIKMYYSSMHRFSDDYLEKHLKEGVRRYGDKFIVGLGTIAVGINGDERILSVDELKRDLEICKRCGVSEVIIYRLEGLNEEYLEVLERFSD